MSKLFESILREWDADLEQRHQDDSMSRATAEDLQFQFRHMLGRAIRELGDRYGFDDCDGEYLMVCVCEISRLADGLEGKGTP